MVTREQILNVLQEVKDPEIPTVSIVELGMITGVDVDSDNSVRILFTPTFVGCPATEMIENLIKEKVAGLNVNKVEVETNFDVQWNSNMISEKGRELLEKHGLAPPVKLNRPVYMNDFLKVKCPYCGSSETEFKSLFGSALCRSIHYCSQCLQSFEQFKPVY
jgi:ring-1,2-phenylacetyl-CoA epoxidase subunit PaaD